MKIANDDVLRPARIHDGRREGRPSWAGPEYDARGCGHPPVPDRQVHEAIRVVRGSALTTFFGARLAPTGSRPVGPGIEALFVSMLLVAREDRPMRPAEFHLLLRHRLSPAARSVLGLDAYAPDGPTRPQVARLYRRLVTVMGTGPVGDEAYQTGTDEHRLVVDHVVGRLLEGTWLLLPRAVRRSCSGPASTVPVVSRGRSVSRSSRTSAGGTCSPTRSPAPRTRGTRTRTAPGRRRTPPADSSRTAPTAAPGRTGGPCP